MTTKAGARAKPSLDDAFRARVVLLFSCMLAIWAPIYSAIMYGLAANWAVVASTMLCMVLVGISPLLLRWGASFLVVGNWLAFNVYWEMLFVGGYAGFGTAPFLWLAVVPMIALVIAGARSALGWLGVNLVSTALYYRYLYHGGADALILSPEGALIFEGTVVGGLFILVVLLSLSFETAKNTAMAQLKASEEWGRTIVEKAADAILTVDGEGLICSANEASTTMFGYDRRTLEGRPFDLLVAAVGQMPPLVTAEREIPFAGFDPVAGPINKRDALRAWAGSSFEAEGTRANGQRIAVEIAIDRLEMNMQERFVVVLRDLTYRKKVEAQSKIALQQTKESFRALIENLPNGVIVHRQAEIQYLNPAASRMLRCEDWTDLVGSQITDLIPPDELDRFAAHVSQVSASTELVSLNEHHFQTLGHEKIPVESTTFRAMFQNESALISIVRDLTESRMMRMTMMQMERMSAVGTLAAGVAHEINNPLTFVSVNLEFIAHALQELLTAGEQATTVNAGEDLQDWSDALDDARDGAERIRKIVSDLLTYSQQNEAKAEPIDVEKVIETTINIAWSEIKHRARLVRDFEPVEPVLGESSSLGQVVLNLLINAAHAIPETHDDEQEIRIGLRQIDEQVIITISDTGTGIPDHILPQIFDPFFTTKSNNKGTGLGLAICRNIVNKLNGQLTVETQLDKGTTFTVTLPITQSRTSLASTAALKDDAQLTWRPRVLIIDDERLVRLAIRRQLTKDFEIDDVPSPNEAFALLAQGAHFDIILCDMMMPEDSGIEFFERLKINRPELADRVIFITGGAMSEHSAKFLETTDAPVLNKPFDTRELHNQIHILLKL
ncbi:MAG: PAS domain S-box protein [Bradymonadaceae bacterium]|nr:PAS domain S-box protein [Lujinxingiaceae bacterium]